MAKDSRFTLPPDDFEDVQLAPASVKGKGKGKQPDKLGHDHRETSLRATGMATASKKDRKRKRATARALNHDDDDGVGEDEEEPDLYDAVLNGPLPSTSQLGKDATDEDDEDDAEDNDDAINKPLNLLPKPLQVDNIEAYNAKVDRTGIIYLSRIPPGMGPSKVKHILSHYGEVGRIYLVAADSSSSSSHHSAKSTGGRVKHRPHRFLEGWVEFSDKTVARHTAGLLNANPIGDAARSKGNTGGKRSAGSRRWKDDVWTMKYLPRFKWNMLSEQVAVEAATRAALLRNQLAQSKKEQSEYLKQVERAKNHEKAQDKKRIRLERRGQQDDSGAAAVAAGGGDGKGKKEGGRRFEQREIVQSNRGVDEKLEKVLDSLF